MSLLTKSALVALLLAGTFSAAQAQQAAGRPNASRQIEVLPAQPAAPEQAAPAAAAEPAANAEVVQSAAPAPNANAKAPAPVAVVKAPVFVAPRPVVQPQGFVRHGYSYGYAPRYVENCNRGYGNRGYRGY